MSRALLEKLSVTNWTPAHATEQAYTAGTVETPPAIGTNADGSLQLGTRWRFVRVQAHDGDLMVNIQPAAAAAPGTGSLRVLNGTAEIFQMPEGGGPSVNVAAVSGTVHGALLWGR